MVVALGGVLFLCRMSVLYAAISEAVKIPRLYKLILHTLSHPLQAFLPCLRSCASAPDHVASSQHSTAYE